MTIKNFQIKLERGLGTDKSAKPVLEVLGYKKDTFLWIGDMYCFAILDDGLKLKSLAKEILRRLGK